MTDLQKMLAELRAKREVAEEFAFKIHAANIAIPLIAAVEAQLAAKNAEIERLQKWYLATMQTTTVPLAGTMNPDEWKFSEAKVKTSMFDELTALREQLQESEQRAEALAKHLDKRSEGRDPLTVELRRQIDKLNVDNERLVTAARPIVKDKPGEGSIDWADVERLREALAQHDAKGGE